MGQPSKIQKTLRRFNLAIDTRIRAAIKGLKPADAVRYYQTPTASTQSVGGGGGAGGGSSESGPIIVENTTLLYCQLTPASGGADTASLGLSTFVGGAQCFYTFKRGTVRGGGSFRLWHDGSDVTCEPLDESSSGIPLGCTWTAALTGGYVILTGTLNADTADAATINLAYITMEYTA